MKRVRVLLIGDSISLGYRNLVKYNLRDWAKVVFPKEQGKYAADVYRMLFDWNKFLGVDNDIDVVYWNAGLWDVVRVHGEEPQTSQDVYKEYLSRIYFRLKALYPNAKIIFGATTPVVEERYTKDFYRYNSDIKEYNKAAYEILYDKVDLYDDLYCIMENIGKDNYIDATHFGSKGNHKLALHICAIIESFFERRKSSFIGKSLEYSKKLHELLNNIYEGKTKPNVYAWGAGNVFRDYKKLILKYCNVKGIIDKDRRMQGRIFEEIECVAPDEIVENIDLIIVTIENVDIQRDLQEYCFEKDMLCCSYQDYLDVLWERYEGEILESDNIVLKDCDPKTQDKMQKYIGLVFPENLCNLDCSYCYISLNKNRRFENLGRKNPHLPQFIRRQFRKEILGGACLIGFTGSGETLLADKFCEVCIELLKEGHYVHIVTNGTPTNKIKEILASAGPYQGHIIFKLSFHYIELLEKRMLDKFVETVKLIESSQASYTVEIMPHDELIPYIPDVLKFSEENFGAYPQLTIGRDEADKTKLLTKQSYKEYIETWNVFKSEMFDTRMKLYMVNGKNCGAGPLGFFVDMYSGKIQHCVYRENLGNVYTDGLENIELNRVGNTCPLDYCFNCHVYATLGILPEDNIPTYMEIRDRVKTDGRHWIKEDMRRFLDVKLK